MRSTGMGRFDAEARRKLSELRSDAQGGALCHAVYNTVERSVGHAAMGWSGGWLGYGAGGNAGRAGQNRTAAQTGSQTGGVGARQHPRRYDPDPRAPLGERSAESPGLRSGEGEFPRLRGQGAAADHAVRDRKSVV